MKKPFLLFLPILLLLSSSDPSWAVTSVDLHQRAVLADLDRYENRRAQSVRSLAQANPVEERSNAAVRKPADSPRKPKNTAYELAKATVRQFTFELGFEFYDYKYRETVNDADFMTLKGSYKGILGAITYRPPSAENLNNVSFYRLEGRLAFGEPDYTGGLNGIDDSELLATGAEDRILEVRALFGKDYAAKGFIVSPYGGLAYRRLENDGSRMTGTFEGETIRGYDRISEYTYLPLGVDIKKSLPSEFTVTLNVEYDLFLWGQQQTNIGFAIEDEEGNIHEYDNFTNDQTRGYGLRAGLKLEKAVKRFSFWAEPYVRYWHIQDSDWARVDAYEDEEFDYDWLLPAFEPENKTTEVGMKVGIGF